jgi:hypothetical protein
MKISYTQGSESSKGSSTRNDPKQFPACFWAPILSQLLHTLYLGSCLPQPALYLPKP